MSVLDQIVKAYDIRGTVPDQLDADVAHALGVGFASFLRSNSNAERIVIARDMRPSGPAFVEAFSRGVLNQGIDVIDLGLGSTDLMYYASGVLDAPGAMFTASHNPAGYNGIKLCVAGARPVGVDTGLLDVKRVADEVLEGGGPKPATSAGSHSERNVLSDFAEHVLTFVDLADIGTMRVVADTANGMGGLVVPAVMERIPSVELEVMYGELDGTFPNHPADPLQPANQRDLRARVKSGGFDIGLAFDGDADRVFVVDELGEGLSGSTTTALLAVCGAARCAGRHDPAQPDLLKERPRGRHRARWCARADQGRALLHQADHGRNRSGLRRRALRSLLLRAQLQRRQRLDRIVDGHGRSRTIRRAAVCGPCPVRALLGQW